MKVINFTVDEKLYEDFKKRLAEDGLTQPQILRAAMFSYGTGDLKLDRRELVSTKEPVHTSIQLEPQVQEKPGPGRPAGTGKKVYKEEEPSLPSAPKLESDPFKAYKNKVHPGLRTIASYYHVVGPALERDDKPHLTFESKDASGKTFRDYFNQYWFDYRTYMYVPGTTDPSDWFDLALDTYMVCVTNKFIEDNDLKLRYHPNELSAAVIEANQELEEAYAAQLEELYKEPT